MTDDVRKLLGGYSTGTLTEEETKALYEAALDDPALFEALADEQALKDLIDNSAARAQVLQATETVRFSIWEALRDWFESPKSKALAATGAVLMIAISWTYVRDSRQQLAGLQSASARPELRSLQQEESLRQASPITGNAGAEASPPQTLVKRVEQDNSVPERSQLSEPAEAEKKAKTTPGGAAGVAEGARRMDAESQAQSLPVPLPELGAVQAGFRDQTLSVEAAEALKMKAAGAVRYAADSSPGAFQAANGFRYTLERQSPSGDFLPMGTATELARGEAAQLRLEFPAPGTASVFTDADKDVQAFPVDAGKPLLVPVAGGVNNVSVAFEPSPLLRESLSRGASLSGFGARRSVPAPKTTAPPSAADAPAAAAPTRVSAIKPLRFNIEIPIRRK